MGEEKSLLKAKEEGSYTVFQVHNATGEGKIISYQVFPGIFLLFNDFRMDHYQQHFNVHEPLFCIDYCREGRMKYQADKEKYSFIEAGDLKIDSRLKHEGRFSFPLIHYYGISVVFELPEANSALAKELQGFPVDLLQLKKKFCQNDWPYLIKQAPSINQIMGELHTVPEKIKLAYYKVKILELLLYLQALELPKQVKQQPYFYKSQVEKIHAIHQLMTTNLEKRYTLDELAKRYEISSTAMKNCFKTVYGYPIGQYMRMYRMNRAAALLKQKKLFSVTEIAGRVGYDSASKFSAAFKNQFGRTPMEYRESRFFLRNRN